MDTQGFCTCAALTASPATSQPLADRLCCGGLGSGREHTGRFRKDSLEKGGSLNEISTASTSIASQLKPATA